MSIHKLTAGSGYDYLTRQVAALDATEKGHTGLASYYTERGETPGMWTGAGMAGIDGLTAGDPVTAEQMQALFGAGLHPLAGPRQAQLDGTEATDAEFRAVGRLGVPFKVYADDISPFRVEVAKRIAALNQASGLTGDWPVPASDRARVRTQVAVELFTAAHGRPPADARELAGTIARASRPQTRAVAGYDLTFSPVKSVSALWAVADLGVAAAVERAHHAAVADALRFLETHALFTREGANGVRQVNVQGLVAAAFTHRDSRAGDPDLHTHVAVANKVQTLDGRWLSIDGRVLFKATVAASETYNTALEHHLQDSLGVQFLERPNPDPRLRPVREVVGVDPALNARWSARRAAIDTRRGQLAVTFQRDHGRPPTPVEALKLAQQATLETRDAKHEPRTLTEQRTSWHEQAVEVLGSPENVRAMVRRALSPTGPAQPGVDAAWVSAAAGRVLAAMETRRSHWQTWHVRAEAHRHVRAANIPTDRVEPLVDLLVAEVLAGRSVSLARPDDHIHEPDRLRRTDGASVYTVAGADLYTSARVLAAEQRLVTTAGRTDGHTIPSSAVDVALLTATANGVTLNAGQAALVRQMATSGRRLQLAIAPAGAGKTTAMQALTAAWTDSGGTVIGLAPSAAAAAQLRDQINPTTNGNQSVEASSTSVVTDTLAKLTWALDHDNPPGWVDSIGPSTLVVVDEAGMADTLSLDTVVQFVVGRGGSVRLVGDDQQLAAVGAGGVLRDIQTSHGAVRLTELLRFADPAEAAASLALRDGKPEALGLYLDQHRVHVGDLATVTDDVFTGWQTDRHAGLDTIMLAPTRDLTAQLNHQARTHRLTETPHTPTPAAGSDSGREVTLADGNQASVGDLVITRTNDRRLRVSATDWVKNGDRWTIHAITDDGDLQVRHTRHGRTVTLPPGYVQASTELGYASTVHTAQGVSVDTVHGLATGDESRQQLYTMLTRGRTANHVYLQVVGDGDPHTVIHPDTVRPLTPTDLLERILAHDDAPRSASTLLRDQQHPAVRLGEATQRYLDSLYVAAEDTLGPNAAADLETSAEQLLPGLTAEPAWPTLRAHLLLLAAGGDDPVRALQTAAAIREVGTADDRAAVLGWRFDDTGLRNTGPGPLPWVPGIPNRLAAHAVWGGYLTARSALVTDLARQVRDHTHRDDPPPWAHHGGRPIPAPVMRDLAVWRAAMQVEDTDRRPTGPVQLGTAARRSQSRLDRAVTGPQAPALAEWGQLIGQVAPGTRTDTFTAALADRLAAIARAGLNARQLLHTADQAGPLPDDHAAAALWWRISRHLTPPVAADIDHTHTLTTGWTPRLADLVGAQLAVTLQASRWWPPLVTAIDHALQRGWRLDDLLHQPAATNPGGEVCQQLVWRITVLTDPADNLDEPYPDTPPDQLPPDDLWHGVHPAANERAVDASHQPEGVEATQRVPADVVEVRWVEADLAVAAMVRKATGPLEQTDADITRMFNRAVAWEESPVSRERMLQINQLTCEFFQHHFPGSWGQAYLTERLGQDLTGDPRYQPGHAPAGWTGLVDHLRRHQVSDREMTATGVATVARTGRLIDRFRDRVVFPIIHNGNILGFVARRHPDLSDTGQGGPKYLNTADTPLFHKGAQLYGAIPQHLADGGVPVVVEGPMDAIAVTLATGGRYVGVAPLGTSLTDEQATQLAHIGVNPIIATDPDLAGQVAAERAFWMLTPHRLDPAYAQLPDGTDPADLLTHHGTGALTAALADTAPLGDTLLHERLTNLPPDRATIDALQVVAARPPTFWDAGSNLISSRIHIPTGQLRGRLLDLVKAWNTDPKQAAQKPLQNMNDVKTRLAVASRTPTQRWAALADELDPRLTRQGDWPALANLLQSAHDQGHNVTAAAHSLVADRPLNQLPAQDLRYRLLDRLKVNIDDSEIPETRKPSSNVEQHRPPLALATRPSSFHR